MLKIQAQTDIKPFSKTFYGLSEFPVLSSLSRPVKNWHRNLTVLLYMTTVCKVSCVDFTLPYIFKVLRWTNWHRGLGEVFNHMFASVGVAPVTIHQSRDPSIHAKCCYDHLHLWVIIWQRILCCWNLNFQKYLRLKRNSHTWLPGVEFL